jgi:hypothetical protein
MYLRDSRGTKKCRRALYLVQPSACTLLVLADVLEGVEMGSGLLLSGGVTGALYGSGCEYQRLSAQASAFGVDVAHTLISYSFA